MRNTFGNVDFYSKIETLDKEYFFQKFEKVLRKKKYEYEDQVSKDNLDRLKSEILDVHAIMTENVNLLIDREGLLNGKLIK